MREKREEKYGNKPCVSLLPVPELPGPAPHRHQPLVSSTCLCIPAPPLAVCLALAFPENTTSWCLDGLQVPHGSEFKFLENT